MCFFSISRLHIESVTEVIGKTKTKLAAPSTLLHWPTPPQCSAVLSPYSDSLLVKHKSERKKKPEWRSYVHASGTVGIVGMHENKLVLLQKSVNFLLNIYMLYVGNAWSLYYSKFTVCKMDLWSAQLGLDVYLQQQRECTNISAHERNFTQSK